MSGGARRGVWRGAAIGALTLLLAACGRDAPSPDKASDAPAASTQPTEAAELAPSATLRAIKRRGRLNCGVHQGLVGFAYTDNRGQWRGFDVDFCRAMAAAIFGDADAARFVPLSAEQRFDALREGRVDVLWRNTSWTMTRDAGHGFVFAGINYYDGQGFLVRRALGLTSAAELSGARVCMQSGSSAEANAADFFRQRGVEYRPVLLKTEEAQRQAYAAEQCDALTGDVAALAAARAVMSDPQAHAVLPDVISKEPLGPVVRADDERWAALTRWVLDAVILAEELGVTQANAEALRASSQDPRVRRLLGVDGDFGAMLELDDDWAFDAVREVGNYGEIFARSLGPQSTLDLARGLNAQWNAAPPGLMYGLPIR
ncbi:amino acid ABC transporter substrate-binding protein [Brevundimonas sp. Leaf363]|uniref:amino acid ABC transporter substrate-binding protein n=1 Tax=Brevundimonas sp. Leaf363 TaxID=1736353 RepID=UPI0009EB2267|nr:amino acid ABC transporter substrate-binding protein [Brevundimonas sp. Leaf363]